ncbi:hypothetical protein AX16_001706 [Volvariella volvacea WC 439]|nr:hypothetical protein AX16_001706 [Volvariella volvacea WC 439]
MPRGVPNARRDDAGMRYTSIHVPLASNPKHTTTTYLKSDAQTLWARNAAKKGRSQNEDSPVPPEQRRGSHVLVIHPGSRYMRIGKASDVTPLTVASVVARRTEARVTKPLSIERIARPRIGRRNLPLTRSATSSPTDDPFDAKLSPITNSLHERMRFFKCRIIPDATTTASRFNEQFQPEVIPEHNDAYRVEWISDRESSTIVGEPALRIADPTRLRYLVRWPFLAGDFNTRDYLSLSSIMADIESLIGQTLLGRFSIAETDYKASATKYSIILVIPDVYDRTYVREFVHLLLVTMGFKQLCVQQESLAATYGAGISSACVVDIGATMTSIACVDEGLVNADTRLTLNVGGDDITEFLYVLLERIHFPYRDIDLARSYDWNLMEDLKIRLCTLSESEVGLNLYDFVVRRPDKPTEKYGLRAYDEVILAPMCLFEPRVIEFDRKRVGLGPYVVDVTDEIIEQPGDQVTHAVVISTQHLLNNASTDVQETSRGVPSDKSSRTPDNKAANTGDVTSNGQAEPMDIIEAEEDKNSASRQTLPAKSQAAQTLASYPGGLPIDVNFEASKLPLDVAIFNSTRAAGDDKIRKYLQAVLVVGGVAHTQGMAMALETRLQAIAAPLVPNMEKVQIIPPPKDVDPRVLVWKGAAVLGKMDAVSELWITPADWDILGMRGLKERCYYL